MTEALSRGELPTSTAANPSIAGPAANGKRTSIVNHPTPNEASTLSPEVLVSLKNAELFDQDGQRYTWSDLTQGKRVVVIFIRHFWCLNCKTYLKLLADQIPPSELPQGTSIIVVGCGQPGPIKAYLPGSPYPIYAHPSLSLHKALGFKSGGGMNKPGEEKAYEAGLGGMFSRIVNGIKEGPGKNIGHVGQTGPYMQNGGEMVLESDGSCSFFHRMQHMSDHTDLEELAKIMGSGWIPGDKVDQHLQCS